MIEATKDELKVQELIGRAQSIQRHINALRDEYIDCTPSTKSLLGGERVKVLEAFTKLAEPAKQSTPGA